MVLRQSLQMKAQGFQPYPNIALRLHPCLMLPSHLPIGGIDWPSLRWPSWLAAQAQVDQSWPHVAQLDLEPYQA